MTYQQLMKQGMMEKITDHHADWQPCPAPISDLYLNYRNINASYLIIQTGLQIGGLV